MQLTCNAHSIVFQATSAAPYDRLRLLQKQWLAKQKNSDSPDDIARFTLYGQGQTEATQANRTDLSVSNHKKLYLIITPNVFV